MKKSIFVFLLALLIAAASLTCFAAADFPAAENVETVIGGVTCLVDYKADGTANMWQAVIPDSSIEWIVPSSIDYKGCTYTVTRLNLSGSYNEGQITSLTLPNTLTDLVSTKFNCFPNLTEITIPGSVKTFTASFQNMVNLKKITFSEGVEEIAANSMVNGCSKLKEIDLPESLKKISQPAAFSGASALETINLPEGVEITQGSTFRNCTSLTSVALPASVTRIFDYMFYGCTALESVTAQGAIAEVGSRAFDGCTKLKTVTGLKSVTKVGKYAFNECYWITGSPDFSQLTEIGEYAF